MQTERSLHGDDSSIGGILQIRTQDADSCPYLTSGKLYDAVEFTPEGAMIRGFWIENDEGDASFVREMHDAHTDSGTWEIVEQGEG